MPFSLQYCVNSFDVNSPPRSVLNIFNVVLNYGDLCGPIIPPTPSGKKYIFLLVDDYSRYMWVYFLTTKDQAFDTFKEYKKSTENKIMVNSSAFLEANWHAKNKCIGHPQQWYQSKNPGKPLRRKAQQAFRQRQIKREKEERIGKCIKQITRDCKDMLKKKLEEIKDFNSSMPQHKYKKYNCFYCKQEGHIIKLCPIKIKDEAEHAQNLSGETAEGNYCVLPTQSKFTLDKSMILCFKCKGYGHFANKCPSKKQEQPKVSIKYPEFIHFKTRGILKGTDQGTWDDFWYISNTTDKHLTSNLNFFLQFQGRISSRKIRGSKEVLIYIWCNIREFSKF
ncbi:ARID DNA-binding domain-containing protein [Tanacetum coccineum]